METQRWVAQKATTYNPVLRSLEIINNFNGVFNNYCPVSTGLWKDFSVFSFFTASPTQFSRLLFALNKLFIGDRKVLHRFHRNYYYDYLFILSLYRERANKRINNLSEGEFSTAQRGRPRGLLERKDSL